MTDEPDSPMSEIEILNAMKNMAKMVWTLYTELVEQGFTEIQAMELCGRYLHGSAGGKVA